MTIGGGFNLFRCWYFVGVFCIYLLFYVVLSLLRLGYFSFICIKIKFNPLFFNGKIFFLLKKYITLH